MKPARSSDYRARGFTLLEVLIATVVFAIVLAAMNGVFYGALRLRNKTHDSVDAGLPSQRTLEIIKRDLSNLVLPGGTLSGAFTTTSTTNMMLGQSSPNFYTASGLIDDTSPWADVQRVTYALISSIDRTASGRDLVRVATRNLLPVFNETQPAQEWLMSGVQTLHFFYYDGNQWRDSWDSTTTDLSTGRANVLPQAVKVQIQLSPRGTGSARLESPIELVVPIVVQSRTNVTQQTGGGTP